jgi:DNA-directed RNA polymerase subunit RPC12/RpoP
MWYIVIVAVLLIGVIFSSKLICQNTKSKSEKSDNKIVINSPNIENDTIKAMFSREQINKKLKRLAETPPPTNLSYGAKCYSKVNMDNQVHEYVCPVCGEKTIYKKGKVKENFFLIDNVLAFDLEACRKQVEKVKGVNISLDETQFCNKCKPNIENPSLCLLVNIAGRKETTRVCSITSEDIKLIQEFLADELVHKGDREEEYPLVNYSDRIKQLLGM